MPLGKTKTYYKSYTSAMKRHQEYQDEYQKYLDQIKKQSNTNNLESGKKEINGKKQTT